VRHHNQRINMESKVWKHSTSPAKKKFKIVVSFGKAMATVFWDITESFLLISCHIV
jgi:hypothetical protein